MMTGLIQDEGARLSERDFSRKAFLKGGGALIVGFSLAGSAVAGKAAAATPTPAGYNPDINQVDSWLTIGADNTATLKTSQIETGNGITTGFLQVVAEELDMDMSQMHYGMFSPASVDVVDTYVAVSSGGEGGSNAMSGTGPKIRNVAALARQALLNMASSNLGVPAANLTVAKGVVSGGGKSVTYGQLIGNGLFNLTGANVSLQPGVAPAKPMSAYQTVTKDPNPVKRIDIPEKVTGEYTYVQQVRVPGMLHGRLVRPRGQGAYPYNSDVPVSYDPSSIAHIPGAQIVHVNNFLGVVAPKEYDAIQAAAQLKVVWNTNPILPGTGNLWSHYRQLDASGQIPAAIGSGTVGNVDAALASAAHTVSGTFKHHYQGHMPIGPSCSIADVTPTGATIWSNTQNVYALVPDLANVLYPLQPNQIRVLFFEGSGSFGNGGVAFDTAESAAVMSKALGKPVRLQMMRWDEHGWTHYGPAIMYDMRAGVDASGNMVAYEATGFSQGGTSLYTGRELAGAGRGSDAQRQRRSGQGGRRRHRVREPLAVDEGDRDELQADQQADRLDDGHLPERNRPGSGRSANGVRRRPDHGHARGRGGNGLARFPVAEHAARRAEPALVGGAPGSRDGSGLEAVGFRLEPRQGEHRHRPRHRQRSPRRRLRRSRRRYPGEQEDREDPRQASLRRPGFRLRGQPRPDLQPDGGEPDPVDQPGALGRGDVQQEQRDQHRLGDLPDPSLQGCPGADDGSRPAHRPALAGLRGAGHVPDDRGDRERVLRRDRRQDARSAHDAGARQGNPRGRRRRLALESRVRGSWPRRLPLTRPSPIRSFTQLLRSHKERLPADDGRMTRAG